MARIENVNHPGYRSPEVMEEAILLSVMSVQITGINQESYLRANIGKLFCLLVKIILLVAFSSVMPALDTKTDFNMADKFLSFNSNSSSSSVLGDPSIVEQRINTEFIGNLTFLIPFMPSILMLVGTLVMSICLLIHALLDRSNGNKWRRYFVSLLFSLTPLAILPYVQVVYNSIMATALIFFLIRDFIVTSSNSPGHPTEKKEETVHKETKAIGWFTYLKPILTLAKTLEMLGESCPQVVLQIVVVLILSPKLEEIWTYLQNDYQENPFLSSTLVSISISFASLIFSGGSNISENYFVLNGREAPPHMSLKMTIVNSLLMTLVITPRILAISITIASFEGWNVLTVVLLCLGLYILGFFATYFIFKKLRPKNAFLDPVGMKKIGLAMMLFSSILTPSAIINPKWDLLIYISILSGTILVLAVSTLISLTFLAPHLLRTSLIGNSILFNGICIAIIIGLIVSMIVTAYQLKWIRNVHSKIFKYQVILGEVDAVKRKLVSNEDFETWIFPYACKYQQEEIVALFLEHGNNSIIDLNAEGWYRWTGYQIACSTACKNENIMRMIEDKAEELAIDLTQIE